MKPSITIDKIGAVTSEYLNKNWKAELNEWSKILTAAKQDPRLKEALERVKILYYLTNGDTP